MSKSQFKKQIKSLEKKTNYMKKNVTSLNLLCNLKNFVSKLKPFASLQKKIFKVFEVRVTLVSR
jgi:hypothetical protein